MDLFSGGRAAIRSSDAVAVLIAASHRAVISLGRYATGWGKSEEGGCHDTRSGRMFRYNDEYKTLTGTGIHERKRGWIQFSPDWALGEKPVLRAGASGPGLC